MIIGYDSVKFGNKRKYVMTASYDRNFSKFYTDESILETDVQVGPIGTLLRKCLDYFSNIYNSKFLPIYIFIYRSGVSEREKGVLLNYEVKSILNLLSGELQKECYKENYKPKFCYLCVNKKTDVKFFEILNNNLNNPKEGTVIDSQVTSPEFYEFYIQPQFVNSGTATPSHFQCIYDTTSIPLEILENITYRMCYYYWNWPGAIREPAALKFAEAANKFSSTYLKGQTVKDELKNSPYYI
jgi:aubergine-like protein